MKITELPSLAGVGLKGILYSRYIYSKPEKLKKIVDKQLQKAVSIAYNETEFYRERYDKYGVHPRDIRSLDDLPKLPIIQKQELIDNFEAAIPKSLNRDKAFLLGTSGSTGNPIRIYKDYYWLTNIWNVAVRAMVGHRLGIPKVMFILEFGNDSFNFEGTMEKYMKLFSFRFQLHDCVADIVEIMEKVEKFNPRVMFTYVGIMRELATLKKNGMGKKLNIKKVWLTGEILDNYTRKHIEEAFGCNCYSLYSSTEGGHVAVECREKRLHINSDFITVEIADKDGNLMPPGKDGSIILTSHDGGYGTPLIRYAGCGDVGQLSPEGCTCRITTPVIGQIKGRDVDSIHLPDGKIFHAFTLTAPMEGIQRAHGLGMIRQYQIVQNNLKRVTISIVSNNGYKKDKKFTELMDAIKKSYQNFFGSLVKVKVVEVKSIPKSNNAGIPTPLVVSHVTPKKVSGNN